MNWFVLDITELSSVAEFSLNMTEFFIIMLELVPKKTEFVLNMNWNVQNITEFVINTTGFVLYIEIIVQNISGCDDDDDADESNLMPYMTVWT